MEGMLPSQLETLSQPLTSHVYLHGPAGSGKTTVGVARMLQWIEAGIPADEILILMPQRSLALPYYEALRNPHLPPGGVCDILTVGGLGQRMISLFWPLAAKIAGFQHPERPPSFLTLETAQYIMAGIVQPFIEADQFLAVNIDVNRLLSQVIDNLNKAAAIGIDHRLVADRLCDAWIGDQADQPRIYQTAQLCANQFRAYCYQENLLDFSLQMELFTRVLWQMPEVRAYLQQQYRYVIYDNIEEDVPAAHDLMLEWLPAFDGALCILDDEAGFRLFLGADPQSGQRLQSVCNAVFSFTEPLVMPPAMQEFHQVLCESIRQPEQGDLDDFIRGAFSIQHFRFHPQMISAVCAQVETLAQAGVPPEEMVILSPFLSDSLRFALEQELGARGLESYTTRPSRSLRDEPATRCLLALARLARPEWGNPPGEQQMTYALMQSIEGLDLVRANLLRSIVYRPAKESAQRLGSFQKIAPSVQERISYQVGERYELLRDWLLAELAAQERTELDVFLARLFGEVLSQPGFAFHRDLEAAAVTARLIESVQKFRRGIRFLLGDDENQIGFEYIAMLERGVIAAQSLQSWEPQPAGTVLLAPAHTFLMGNRPARFQFWLDAGSPGWWQRLQQPLTHPVVLSRRWPEGSKWTDVEEQQLNLDSLMRVAGGLLRRCGEKVFFYTTQIDQQGYESSGLLLMALQNILLRLPLEDSQEDGDV